MRTLPLLAVAVALATASCQPAPPADFTPASLLNSLRILAVKAEPPDVAPGQTTTLSALVYNPEYDDTEIHYLWVMCDPDLTSTGVASACSNFDTARDPSGLLGSIFSSGSGVHVDPFSREMARYTPPADLFNSLPTNAPERKSGVPAEILLIVYVGDINSINDPKSVKVFSLKTLRIAEVGPETNANPSIDAVNLNGDVILNELAADVSAGAKIKLSAVPSAASRQSYTRILPDGTTATQDEQLVFSWYTTAGQFDAALDVAARTKGTDPIEFSVPKPYEHGAIEVFAILRDARGGMDWTRRVLRTP